MTRILITVLLMICLSPVFAQTVDTITKTKSTLFLDKFPSKRNFEFKYEQFTPNNYSSELAEKIKGNGRFSNHFRFKAAVTVPVYVSSDWLINASFKYKYEVFKYDDSQNELNLNSIVTHADQKQHHLFTSTFSVTRLSTLLGKRVVYNGTFIADASAEDFGRIKGNLSATMILKRTKKTSVAVGVLGFFDRTAPFFILPILSYQHQFQNAWALDVFLPQRAFLRKNILKNGRISLGTEVENELLYIRLNNPDLTGVYAYRQIELKSGITYEHNHGRRIITTFKAGITSYQGASGNPKGQSSDELGYKTTQKSPGYFSLGVSYHPFEK